MAQLDLRPLSVGEILDRMFTIYRGNFLFFIGITAIPQILVLAFQLGRIFLFNGRGAHGLNFGGFSWIGSVLVSIAILLVAYVAGLFTQATTILAVSDLYLGRPITISDCLRRAVAEIGTVFGVGILSSLAVLAGAIALLFPGFYILCRLIVAVPAALIEQRGPQDSLRRSWNLTKDNAGRSFVIILLYFAISMAAGLLIGLPFGIAIVMNKNNPGALQIMTSIAQVGNALLTIVVVPVLLISTSVFYFDLRVRKEAFDLQFMMDPTSERLTPPGSGIVQSIL